MIDDLFHYVDVSTDRLGIGTNAPVDSVVIRGVNHPVVTVGKGEPGHVRFTGTDGSFYDISKAMMPDVIAALVRVSLDCG